MVEWKNKIKKRQFFESEGSDLLKDFRKLLNNRQPNKKNKFSTYRYSHTWLIQLPIIVYSVVNIYRQADMGFPITFTCFFLAWERSFLGINRFLLFYQSPWILFSAQLRKVGIWVLRQKERARGIISSSY